MTRTIEVTHPGKRPLSARAMRRVARGLRLLVGTFSMVITTSITGCSGQQSALAPAGKGATQIAELFWWMAGGAIVVWVIMIALTLSALRGRVGEQTARQARFYIIGGGAIFPTVVLTALLIYGLGMMPGLIARAPEGSLNIVVTGEQWWWRVHYQLPNGEEVVLANEIRLPVGEPVQFTLQTADVIHSFWIPSLGGKMDMLPGRTTHLALHPEKTGVLRGICAEYCGGPHALMAFYVVVMEKEEFDVWLDEQSRSALEPQDDLTSRGLEAFLTNGCAACHTIRGAGARGVVGPDLTHVGSRVSLGAGIMTNEPDSFERWIALTDKEKPGVHMPHFRMLPPEELQALAAYLESLK